MHQLLMCPLPYSGCDSRDATSHSQSERNCIPNRDDCDQNIRNRALVYFAFISDI